MSLHIKGPGIHERFVFQQLEFTHTNENEMECERALQLRCLELLDDIPKKRQQILEPEIIEVYLNQNLTKVQKKVRKALKWNSKSRINKFSKKQKKSIYIGSRSYRVIEVPKNSGKKPKVEKRWQLLCNHCKVLFLARPTPKNSRYVVNHQCQPDGVRRQYIIGVKGRNCVLPHESACIQHVECFGPPIGL